MERLGWFIGQRVELIAGEVVVMPAFNPPHSAATSLTEKALEAAFGSGFWVRTGAPISLPGDSEPEPDVSVVPGGPRDYLAAHPTTALLVVEVCESTLREDRNLKGSLYAAAGLQDYWIVNLVDRQLEVYRKPIPDANEPHGFVYDEVTFFGPADFVTPLALPHAKIAVADLLP
ncbi:MAG TPA: Uma2 family endonuclease [Gemmataceae bacterium]|nr:Uma2 family endonuclease [Gemmataceae bacterium]